MVVSRRSMGGGGLSQDQGDVRYPTRTELLDADTVGKSAALVALRKRRFANTVGITVEAGVNDIATDKDFNILANGTDETAKLQNAITSISEVGGLLFLGPRTIRAVGLTYPRGNLERVIIRGHSWRTRLQLHDDSAPFLTLDGNADTLAGRVNALTLEDLTLRGSGVSGTSAALVAKYAHQCLFSHICVEAFPGDGIRFEGTGFSNIINDGTYVWNNGGVGVKDATVSPSIPTQGDLAPLKLNDAHVSQNAGGGVELASAEFMLVNNEVQDNGNWQVWCHKNSQGSIVNNHLERDRAAEPLLLIGDASEIGLPAVSVTNTQFYGNREATSPPSRPLNRAVYVVRGRGTSLTGCYFGNIDKLAEAATGAGTSPGPITEVGSTRVNLGSGILGFPQKRELIPTNHTSPAGILAETMDRSMATSSGLTAPTSQQMRLYAIPLLAGQKVSTITFYSGGTAGSGLTNQWFALYDPNLNKLGVTTDDASPTVTTWAANTPKPLNLTTPYIVPVDGLYYVGIVIVGTTPPTMWGSFPSNATINAIPPVLAAVSTAGLTTPATAPPIATQSAVGPRAYANVS